MGMPGSQLEISDSIQRQLQAGREAMELQREKRRGDEVPYRSRKQQGFFHFMAGKGGRWSKLARRWDKETYKGKGGSKSNKRRFARLPVRARKKRS